MSILTNIVDVNSWLMSSALEPIFDRYRLSLVIKSTVASNKFKSGSCDNYIVSTIKGVRPTASGTIEVQYGNREKDTIPLRYLHPVCVTLKNVSAIITEGELCGKIVKVKKVVGDTAEVAEAGSKRELRAVMTAHLCKFS